MLQSSGYGFAGIFPHRIISSLSNGAGLSGVVIGICRAFSLVVFPADDDNPNDPNLFKGALLYFGISTSLCIIFIIFLLIMFKTDYNLYYYTKNSMKQTAKTDNLGDSFQSLGEVLDKKYNMENINTENSLNNSNKEGDVSIMKIHSEHWMNLWGILINFGITFVIFPGLLLQGKISFF